MRATNGVAQTPTLYSAKFPNTARLDSLINSNSAEFQSGADFGQGNATINDDGTAQLSSTIFTNGNGQSVTIDATGGNVTASGTINSTNGFNTVYTADLGNGAGTFTNAGIQNLVSGVAQNGGHATLQDGGYNNNFISFFVDGSSFYNLGFLGHYSVRAENGSLITNKGYGNFVYEKADNGTIFMNGIGCFLTLGAEDGSTVQNGNTGNFSFGDMYMENGYNGDNENPNIMMMVAGSDNLNQSGGFKNTGAGPSLFVGGNFTNSEGQVARFIWSGQGLNIHGSSGNIDWTGVASGNANGLTNLNTSADTWAQVVGHSVGGGYASLFTFDGDSVAGISAPGDLDISTFGGLVSIAQLPAGIPTNSATLSAGTGIAITTNAQAQSFTIGLADSMKGIRAGTTNIASLATTQAILFSTPVPASVGTNYVITFGFEGTVSGAAALSASLKTTNGFLATIIGITTGATIDYVETPKQ